MATFLTVKEAARFVNKSPSSVRRIIHPIVKSDDHSDRLHIQPTVEEVAQLRLKGEGFAWRISEELLLREMPRDESGKTAAGNADVGLLAMLERELAIKN